MTTTGFDAFSLRRKRFVQPRGEGRRRRLARKNPSARPLIVTGTVCSPPPPPARSDRLTHSTTHVPTCHTIICTVSKYVQGCLCVDMRRGGNASITTRKLSFLLSFPVVVLSTTFIKSDDDKDFSWVYTIVHVYLPQMSDSFLQQAALSAEQSVREWIRKTLREVMMQALQNHIRPSTSSHHRDDDVKMAHLSLQDLQVCFKVVKRVSDGWRDELQKHKHIQTASWVQDVWESGRDNLWSQELSLERWNEILASRRHATSSVIATNENGAGSSETDLSIGANATQNDNPDVDAGTDNGLLKVPYCVLRTMVRPHSCQDDDETGDEILSKLKRMGQTKGQSYWPLDPQILEEAAQGIPKRQRCEKKGPRKASRAFYQLVPPSQNENNQQQGGEEEHESADSGDEEAIAQKKSSEQESSASHQIISEVLKRRRTIRAPPKKSMKRGQLQPTISQSLLIGEIPRPASTISTSSLNTDELTAQEKEELQRSMIHSEEVVVDDEEPSPTMIFGTLQEFGSIHAMIREQIKQDQGQRTMDDMTDAQRRRQQRAYVKERLAPHRSQKNQDPQKYRSKILRTEQDCEDGTTKHFLEFDLGWSLVEYEKDGEKRLMAFDSIQAALEEKTPDDTNG